MIQKAANAAKTSRLENIGASHVRAELACSSPRCLKKMSLHVISVTGRHDTVAVYFKNLGRKRSCNSFGMDITWQHWHQRAMRCFVISFTMGWFYRVAGDSVAE